MWPILLDSSEEECLKTLRRLELEAYGSLVSALRAQGGLTAEKLKLLKDTAAALHITPERHRAEIRRAVNDEQLGTIAQFTEGPDTYAEWSVEGRRKVRLVPRVVPQTAFLAVARRVADAAQADNAKMPWPAATARSMSRTSPQLKHDHEEGRGSIKKRRRLSQESLPPPAYVPPISKHRLQKHGISKIQQVYKSQNRISVRQQSQPDISIMPPPRTTIKTLPPVKQRVEVSKPHTSAASISESPLDSPQKSHPVTVAKVIQSGAPVNKGLIKISQTTSQQHQKLVIVSASQNINPNILHQSLNNSSKITTAVNSVKIRPSVSEDHPDTPTVSKPTPKIITSQVIVSKSQLTPLQTLSMGEKPKVLTVQAKVRPQGSIIVPLQGQNAVNTGQFAGVSVPVLQGVQWKAIQGKSTVKLLPLSGNAKIIQKQGSGMGSGPIYVMSKPGNLIVSKTAVSAESSDASKAMNNITHIRPLTAAQKADDGKVLVVRKAVAGPSAAELREDATMAGGALETKEERKSTVLQDALRASGVTNLDDDIESQISQYTAIPKNKGWSSDEPAPASRPLQNIQLQDTKFLTLEEAVAILGDSSETRALLSQLQVESSPTDGQLDPQTGIYSPVPAIKPPAPSETVDSKMDIFSTALASADIQLEETVPEFFDNIVERDTNNTTDESATLTDKQLTDILTGETNR